MDTKYNYKEFELGVKIEPWEATYLPKTLVAIQEAIGACAGEFVIPYPPGVPIVVPGEVISKQVVNYIEEGCRKGYNINGVYGKEALQVNIIRR